MATKGTYIFNPDSSYTIEREDDSATIPDLKAEMILEKIDELPGAKTVTIILSDIIGESHSLSFDIHKNGIIGNPSDDSEAVESIFLDLLAIGIANGAGVTVTQYLDEIVEVTLDDGSKEMVNKKCMYGISLGDDRFYFATKEEMKNACHVDNETGLTLPQMPDVIYGEFKN